MRRLLTQALLAIAIFAAPLPALAKLDMTEVTQKTAERQVRNLLEPILDKYCRDECKLLSVNITVDLASPDEVAPGFEDIDPKRRDSLAPSLGKVKILIDDKVGPVSRGKLVDLLQQYLDTLEYPVKIETQVAHFPQPIESSAKIAEMREKILKQFRGTMDELFQQFCPEQCMLGDLSLKTEVVNGEELQYGGAGEFQQDGDTAIRIRDLSASILMDETLSPEERQNLLEMAKLKTNYLKNVTLEGKTLKFPHGMRAGGTGLLADGSGPLAVGRVGGLSSNLKSSNETNSKLTTNDSRQSSSTTNDHSTTNATHTNKNNTRESSSNTSNNTNDNSTSSTDTHQERFERIEKIERVESGDALAKELEKFKFYGLIFGCSILSLLIFVAIASFRPQAVARLRSKGLGLGRAPLRPMATATSSTAAASTLADSGAAIDRASAVTKRYEIERITEELMAIYAQQPKVAKHAFSRILTEEGVETTSYYIWMLGENVVMDMLRDPSLQSDMAELMEFYAKNTFELTDDDRLDLLRKLHNRTVASKLAVLGNRSTSLFDFLAEMDALQILELIRNESLTIKAIILTQCDPQKRAVIYAQMDEHTRMAILTELSRIDYLPRDYIYNVSNALKRKRKENPKLNTEALPGSEVLVSLLERTSAELQRSVVRNLEAQHPDSARSVKAKLVCLDTLRFLRDGQLLEVVLSLRHDELLTFLKGAPDDVRGAIFAKSPKELINELEDELTSVGAVNREAYSAIERKVLNRLKLMANEGLINLIETNERMFAENRDQGYVVAGPPQAQQRAA